MKIMHVGAFLLLGAISASAQDQWTARTDVPGYLDPSELYSTNFTEMGLASDDRYLYYCGRSANVLHRYDTVTDAWTGSQADPLSPQRVPNTFGNSLIAYNGMLYVIGYGFGGSGITWKYDFLTNMCTRLIETCPNGFRSAAALLGSRIYILGGDGAASNCTAFDPATETFTSLAPMPTGRSGLVVVAVPSMDRVYAIGGRGAGGEALGACEEFNPAGNSWRTCPGMLIDGTPEPRLGAAGFCLINRVFVAGGRSAFADTMTTLEYDPIAEIWSRRTDMGAEHVNHGAVACGGRGYLVDGRTCESYGPPEVGSPPSVSGFTMSGAGAEAMQQGDWTNGHISFSATVRDVDLVGGQPQRVRLEVQVKPDTADWSGAVTVHSGYQPQGVLTIVYVVPAAGNYDVRYRALDSYNNSTPVGSWSDLNDNAVSPDFRSDQSGPTRPNGITPSGSDEPLSSPHGGAVTFAWTASADVGPAPGARYEMQVALDPAFSVVEGSMSGLAATSTSLWLRYVEARYYWRVRAVDGYGHSSGWSTVLPFHVTYRDGIDNGAGDATKACGFGVAASGNVLAVLLLAALLMAIGFSRWFRNGT